MWNRDKLKQDLIITLTTIMCPLLAGCGEKAVNTPVVPIVEPISEISCEMHSDNEQVESTNPDESGIMDENIYENVDSDVEITDDSVSIIMVGDMLLHDRIEAVSKNGDGSYEYSAIFEHTKDLIASADIAIVNEEVIIGGSELGISGYPAFNAPYEFADELVDTGFDVICHGTNHALDKGGRGIDNCLMNWKSKYPDVAVLGIHDSTDDQQEIYICEKNGIKIAILNYTYGTNGISLPADMPYGVDYLSEEKVIMDLERAEKEADFTIVCPHWGTEYSLEPDSYQKKWADIFAMNGADLIIGTHPHVIEKVDWISHDESGKTTLCYYSLGNFVNWTSGSGAGVSNRMLGAMARVELKRTGDNKVVIDNYDAVPLVSHVTSEEDGVTVYPLSEYTEELAVKNEIIIQAADFSLDYCRELADEILGDVIR